jgi:5,10-methylenetetrahydromethanopterin reductase
VIPASVNLIPEAPIAEVVALARQAEALGYDRCWVYDEGLATRDVYVALTAIAQVTTTIKVGPGITNPYTRHPATTATTIATLDEFSGGRAFLGIGAGGSLTLGPLGVDRRHPLAAVGDLLQACRALFSGQPVTMTGQGFSLNGATLGFARPDIEIWLAGRGPKMLGLGGELADGVMLDFIHAEMIDDYVELVRAGARRSGNEPRLMYSTMVITDERAMAATKPHMTYRLVDSPPRIKQALGITDLEVARIRRAMAGGLHAAAEFVRDEWVHPFVIAGTESDCAEQLARLVDRHGIDEFLLPVLDLADAPQLMTQVAGVLAAV